MDLVNRLRFDVTCNEEPKALHVRHIIAHSYQTHVIDAIDRITSQYSREDETLVIDKIEIDLGDLSVQEFERDFVQQFEQIFERSLKEKINLAGEGRTAQERKQYYHRNYGRRLASGPGEEKFLAENNGREFIRSQLPAEMFRQFALSGSVPWWFSGTEDHFHEMLLEAIVHNEGEIKTFLFQQKYNKQLWYRLSYQLLPAEKLALINLLAGLEAARSAISTWLQIPALSVSAKSVLTPDDVCDLVLQHAPILLNSETPIEKSALMVAWQFIKNGVQINPPVSLQEMMTDASGSNRSVEITKLLEAISSNISTRISYSGLLSYLQEQYGTAAREMPFESLKKIDPAIRSDETESDISVTIHDAGLVLIASFLPTFFSRLELLENGKWKDRASLYRGIHLLYFMVSGEQHPAEYQLLFPKLLAGCPPEEAVPRQLELTEEEKRETEILLQSVIEYWTAIRNTSVNGLRATFLSRAGRLQKTDNGWDLVIERKTVDVLVDRLPWSFSLINFQWIHYLIYVQW